jgi:NAD(P)-dependent dehydrogenase (short-subunit alcohol dehydrogenase family)
MVMDVASDDSIKAAFAEIAQTLPPVSIVVNNAGAALTKPVLDITAEEWRTIMRTNLSGAWTVSNIAGRQMIDNQIQGSIINIGSILGFIAMKAVSAYSVSKAGLLELTQQLAAEFGPHGIRVNAIAPGYVRTALSEEFFARSAERMAARIPLRRFLEPSDLDGPLLLLASDAGRAITGATLVVDCGHHVGVSEAVVA